MTDLQRLALVVASLGAASLSACGGSGDTDASVGSNCDRSCLEAFVDTYLEALVGGDPSGLPLAADVVFVENNQRLELGEGTWRTVTGLGAYRHYFADPLRGQAGLIGVVEENGQPIIYDLRLAIENRLITEIEGLAIRDPAGAARYEERESPHPKFLETVPVAERLSREELVAVADRYLSGMQRNDPDGDYSFFHDDCDRWEHALQTTNNDPAAYGHSSDTQFVTLSCREQFETGFLGFVTRIRDRRYAVVDEERQSVLGFAMLDHNGTIRSIPLADQRTFDVPPYFSTPRTLEVGEAWRIEDGKLRQIEMTLTEFPYGLRPSFSRGDDWLASASAQKPTRVSTDVLCDRYCLESFVDALLGALIRRNPAALPVTDSLIYTENGQRLDVGDGLWGTITEIRNYYVVAADPDSNTAVFIGAITETDVPGVLFARLTLHGERVGEIETFVVRHETQGDRGGTLTLFAPRLESALQPQDFMNIDPSLDFDLGFQSEVGVATLENVTASYREDLYPGVTVRDRRTWVNDIARGLVVDLVMLDVANESSARSDELGESSGPYSIMSAGLYKIVDGTVLSFDSAQLPVPYRMGSGWD
jgi:hypothetical protein